MKKRFSLQQLATGAALIIASAAGHSQAQAQSQSNHVSETAQYLENYVSSDENGICFTVAPLQQTIEDFGASFRKRGVTGKHGDIYNPPENFINSVNIFDNILNILSGPSSDMGEVTRQYDRFIELHPGFIASTVGTDGVFTLEEYKSLHDKGSIADDVLLWNMANGYFGQDIKDINRIEPGDRFYLSPALEEQFIRIGTAQGELAGMVCNDDYDSLMSMYDSLLGKTVDILDEYSSLEDQNSDLRDKAQRQEGENAGLVMRNNSLVGLIDRSRPEAGAYLSGKDWGLSVGFGLGDTRLTFGHTFPSSENTGVHTSMSSLEHETLPILGYARLTTSEEKHKRDAFSFTAQYPLWDTVMVGATFEFGKDLSITKSVNETWFEIDGVQVDYSRIPQSRVHENIFTHFGPSIGADLDQFHLYGDALYNPDSEKFEFRGGLNIRLDTMKYLW